MGQWAPAWRDLRVPAAVVLSQVLWWPLRPWWFGAALDARPLAGVCAVAVVAFGALLYRRRSPELALLCTALATALSEDLATVAIAGPVAVVLTSYGLVVHRTAVVSAVGVAAVVLGLAVAAAFQGASLRAAAGAALVFGAVGGAVWAVGRLRRRIRVDKDAAAAFRAASDGLAPFAVAEERRRLAAELHDVAAHRLTAIVVSAGAALRLANPALREGAVEHAVNAGRQAVEDLDRLVTLAEPDHEAGNAAIDALVAQHPSVRYEHTAAALPPTVTGLVYRIVREALTNIMRYAEGAATTVRIAAGDGWVSIDVLDDGGTSAAGDLGTGRGLAGLRARVEAAGGSLEAGPAGPGWRVHARLPARSDPATGTPTLNAAGGAIRDRALVVLALGLSMGAVLLPSADDPDPLASPVPAMLLVALLTLHALPLAWRRLAPGPALCAALAILLAWLGCTTAGWTRLDPAETFLWCWWVELALVYAVAAYRPANRFGLGAPLAVAAVGGAALGAGAGITGNRIAAAAVLAVMLTGPLIATWVVGRLVAARRSRQAAAEAREREALLRRAEGAARNERFRIADGLRRSAREHAVSAVAAAEAGRLDEVATQARAGLHALRKLLHGLPEDTPDPPPAVAALADLAARRRSSLRYIGAPRPLPAPLEVVAHRAGAALITDGAAVVVTYTDNGLGMEVRRRPPAGRDLVRPLRHLVDAAGGSVTLDTDRTTVRVWLPEALR
ncbi:histidine kinase [Dactylosporangium sp. AC04546]|uniref:ATP-binding protein n=1 Tax=Dactylosporangium sp. AC04546 TaxID=2862460 RepID=UPI001EDDC275|nr:ATP-binding protein [Dactylosporangium sp. AC04546]WVK80960.1 histidine kinase [Dactylosporangium sp. AC04546]